MAILHSPSSILSVFVVFAPFCGEAMILLAA
jgi:hypothetical protein